MTDFFYTGLARGPMTNKRYVPALLAPPHPFISFINLTVSPPANTPKTQTFLTFQDGFLIFSTCIRTIKTSNLSKFLTNHMTQGHDRHSQCPLSFKDCCNFAQRSTIPIFSRLHHCPENRHHCAAGRNKICYSCKKLWQGKPTFPCQSWVHTLESCQWKENMENVWVVRFFLNF